MSDVKEILPWHHAAYAELWGRRTRLPHALLIHGRKGTGKLDFAIAFIQALLCERPRDSAACGVCPSCNWFFLGSHPDFRLLEPLTSEEAGEEGAATKKSTQIIVDQVRALSDFLAISTHRGGWRAVLLHPAEALNTSAANALLKGLEEPPAQTLFVLVTHRLHRVLPTIKSRCQMLGLAAPTRPAAAAWLEARDVAEPGLAAAYTGDAPLLALRLSTEEYWDQRRRFVRHLAAGRPDPIAAAEDCQDAGLPLALEWLQKWTYDVAARRISGGVRYNIDQASALERLAAKCDPVRMLRFHRSLVHMQRHADHPLNVRLALERLFMDYAQATAAGEPGR